MIQLHQRVAVMGFTQSGKTVFVKWLVDQAPACLVYDVKRQYAAFGKTTRSVEETRQAFRQGFRKVIYQPEQVTRDDFDRLCLFVYQSLRNCLFVVEEVQAVATKSKIPSSFTKVLTIMEGDPYRVGVVCVSQRPANMHNDILTQSSVWIVFQLARNDAFYIGEMTSIPEDEIFNLTPKHFFLYKNRAVEGEPRVVRFPPLGVRPELLHG